MEVSVKRKNILILAIILNAAILLFLSAMYEVVVTQEVFKENAIGQITYFMGSGLLLIFSSSLSVILIQKRRLQKKAKWMYPLISGIISASIATLAFVFASMFPWGDNNIMMVDMWGQYTPMLADLKALLMGDGSWFYTNQIGLGTNFLPLFGYYLASPFNLLLVFFPTAYLPQAFMLITIIKIALCGAAFTACAQYLFNRQHIATITCGVMYSGMFFILAYSWCIMWLDVLILLPLCVMLLERMLKTKKMVLYSVTLAITIALNFYMAFIVCIFLALYWLVWAFKEERTKEEIMQGFITFVVASLLGGGLSALITLPVVLGLQGTSAANDTLPAWNTQMPLFNIPTQMLYNTTLTIRSGNYANIGCGILALVSGFLYFTTKAIPVRRRIVYGALLVLLALSFTINRLDLIWHGFHAPNDLPYRYSFIWSFVLLIMTCDLMQYIETISTKTLLKTAAVMSAWLMLVDVVSDERLSFSVLFVSLLFISLYFVVILYSSITKHTAVASVLILFVVIMEVLSQSSIHRFQMDKQEGYGSQGNWTSEENSGRQHVARAFNELSTDSFYRSEMLPLMTFQDSALFNYEGISSFASTYYYTTTKTMKNLGYESNGINSSVYRSFMPTIDSLLGIKYIALRSDLSNYQGLNTIENYDLSNVGWYLYENETALSLGYMATAAIADYESTRYNPIQTQNDLYRALTGEDQSLFLLNSVKAVTNNYYTAHEITVNDTAFGIPNKGSESVATFEIEIEHPGHVFVYVDCTAAKDIVVKGVSTWNYPHNQPYFIDNSYRLAGDKVTIEVTSEGVSGNIYVATINEEVFESAINKLKDNELQVTTWENGLVEGTIDVSEAGVLMLSIPYDKGWSLSVDGNSTALLAIDEAFLGAYLEEGQHHIKLTYTPPGLIVGSILSVLSAIILFILTRFKIEELLKRLGSI